MTDSPRADVINLGIEKARGRTGSCRRCGLCCLLGNVVKRVPKKEPPREPGEPRPREATWGHDLVILHERGGYRVALETTGYYFMAKWDPCRYYWFDPLTGGLGCSKYATRPDSCRTLPHNNDCLWLVVRRYCGYNFPKPGGDRELLDDDREPVERLLDDIEGGQR